MSKRALEIVFLHKAVLIAPMLFFFAIGVLLATNSNPYYASRATIWVEKPSDTAVADFNTYATPAQNQAGQMRELLATRAFVERVLKRIGDSEYSEFAAADLRARTQVWPYSEHVLFVEYRSTRSETAAKAVNALVDQYSEEYTAQVTARASRASDFYKGQLDVAEAAVDSASLELRQYVASHPKLANVDLTDPPDSALSDVDFARLVLTEQSARASYNKILESYAQSAIVASTASGASPYFYVVDPPEVPMAPTTPSYRSRLLKPMAGLIFGALVSGLLFGAFYRMDRSVRLGSELALLVPNVPIIALPRLRTRRQWPAHAVRIVSAFRGGFRLLQAGENPNRGSF